MMLLFQLEEMPKAIWLLIALFKRQLHPHFDTLTEALKQIMCDDEGFSLHGLWSGATIKSSGNNKSPCENPSTRDKA